MGKFAKELGQLKSHVPHPATKAQVVAACNNNVHAKKDDTDWMAKALPEGTYGNANEVLSALITKVQSSAPRRAVRLLPILLVYPRSTLRNNRL